MKKVEQFLGLTRIFLGLIFLWAFFDKLLGLGFATAKDSAWIHGGSPTTGFLQFATKGPFAEVFQALAGSVIIDVIFMIGLLLIGISLFLGIFNTLAGYSGALMMLLMYLAVLPPEHHPFLDDHIIYGLILIYLANKDTPWSLKKDWKKTKLVKRYGFLE